jgi:hypothetical protein
VTPRHPAISSAVSNRSKVSPRSSHSHLWDRFDSVVKDLGETLAGPVPSTVEHAYFELSLVMTEIADALDEASEQARASEPQRNAG